MKVFSTSSKAALTFVVAALVVACILSCRLLARRDVGEEERYCEGEAVPLIKAAALGPVLDFSGDEIVENRFLAGPMASEARERMDVRPGTVFIAGEDDDPLEPATTVLYGELNMLREDLGDDGGVVPLSRSWFIPPGAGTGEVRADSADSPFIVIESVQVLPGDAKGLGVTWTGYGDCCTTVFIGEEMVL